jgi:hypothetical protein
MANQKQEIKLFIYFEVNIVRISRDKIKYQGIN